MASIKLVIIFTIVIQCIDGYQRIRQASDYFSDDEDFFASDDGNFSILVVCIYLLCVWKLFLQFPQLCTGSIY